MLPMLLLAVPAIFFEYMGLTMIWFLTWILFAIVSPMIVFAKHRAMLLALKREKNWYSAAAGRALVDIKAAALPVKKISGVLFLPPVVSGIAAIAYAVIKENDKGMIFFCVVFTMLIVFYWMLYYLIFRVRTELVNDDASLTVALTRVRRYNWGILFLAASWLTGAALIVSLMFLDNLTILMVSILSYALLVIALSIYTEFAVRIAQQKLTSGNNSELYLDEDDYWLFGLFYHNPNDSHFLVNDRVGMNMTVNLARPAGKAVMFIAALLILSLPFLGVWIWKEESVPPRLVLNESVLTSRHTKDMYVIKLDTIESAQLIDSLPAMIKTGGMNAGNLYKGSFRAGSFGASSVNIRPLDPPFLVIKADGQTYILNDDDSSITVKVYETLKFD
jgi:uncharacterized membrane protein